MIVRLITNSSHEHGFGHLSRSRIIEEQFRELRHEVELLQIESPSDLIEALTVDNLKVSIFVIDLDPRLWQTISKPFLHHFDDGNFPTKVKFFIFDDPNFTIRKLLGPNPKIITFINPYHDDPVKNAPDILSGLDYFPFPTYLHTIRREGLNKLDRFQIAISCGGSDPHRLTDLYLGLLNSFQDTRLDIAVFIGPLFKTQQIKDLKHASNRAFHRIRFITQEDYVDELFRNTSLALTTGGLTRYELAFCGIPFMTMSFDVIQDFTSKIFSGYGACIYLGNRDQRFSDLQSNFLLNLKRLLKNETDRIEMAEKGKQLFTGEGFHLVETMIELAPNEG